VDLVLQIGTDPAAWTIQNASYETVHQELFNATGPVALNVASPLRGRLLISRRCAGSVAMIQPPGGIVWETRGWNPSGAYLPPTGQPATEPPGTKLPALSFLYLPSVTGPVPGAPRYAVSNVTAAALEKDILTAMADGTIFSVNVSAPTGNGGLILNGAALPFAVLYTAMG
jgi:hypothetical protein